MGYNGTPKGWDDSKFPWGKDMSLGEENTKYPYVVHAEENAILNLEKNRNFDRSVFRCIASGYAM